MCEDMYVISLDGGTPMMSSQLPLSVPEEAFKPAEVRGGSFGVLAGFGEGSSQRPRMKFKDPTFW